MAERGINCEQAILEVRTEEDALVASYEEDFSEEIELLDTACGMLLAVIQGTAGVLEMVGLEGGEGDRRSAGDQAAGPPRHRHPRDPRDPRRARASITRLRGGGAGL